MASLSRRSFVVSLFGLASAACGLKVGRVGGDPYGGANTNMTAADREKGRANLARIAKEAYLPDYERLRAKLDAALAATGGEQPASPAGRAQPASRVVKALTAPKGSVAVTPHMGGLFFTVTGDIANTSDLDALVRLASDAHHEISDLTRNRHFDVVLSIVAFRAQFGELEDVDYERIRAEIDVVRAMDELAALALAHVAAYQSAVATRDVRVLESFPPKARKALAAKLPPATRKDAEAYVETAAGSLRTVKAEYVKYYRATMGDEAFAKVERAVNQMFDPYIAMAERDAKGTDVRLMGEPHPGHDAPPPAGAGSGSGPKPDVGAALATYLDATSAAFPVIGVVLRGLEGARALAKGDSKAAIDAAVSMIPASGLAKDALTTAAALVKSRL